MAQFAGGDPAFINQLVRTFVHGETFDPTGLRRISTTAAGSLPRPDSSRNQGPDNSPAYMQAVRQVESIGIDDYMKAHSAVAAQNADSQAAGVAHQQQRQFNRRQPASISALETITNVTSLRDRTDVTVIEGRPVGLAAPRLAPRCVQLSLDNYEKLPILQYRAHILRSLECSDIIFIQGNTGCGKSTQVPQYIFDNAIEREEPVNIIVTQPRRIAATSVSDWVCKQRGWTENGYCGYQIGMDNKQNQDTCILYVTTGVLLEKLIHSKRLDAWSHIVLDEAHERDIEMDMCLLIIKQLMSVGGCRTKLVVMSATMDDAKIRTYLKGDADQFLDTINVTEAPYTVDTYGYYDAIQRVNDFVPRHIDVRLPRLVAQPMDYDDLGLNEHKMELIKRLIASFEHGAVLVFLPGLYDIIAMSDYLKDTSNCVGIDPNEWEIIPLHSTVSADQQRRAFKHYPGKRKVILSTNIAESSITIDDIIFVIDLCQTKYLCKDDNSTLSCLRLDWASKSNLKQRAGRAGRTQAGVCYRLITPDIDGKLEEFEPSSMLRCPIDQCILKVKLMDEVPLSFLSAAIDPPSPNRIAESIIRLKLVAALTSDIANHFDGDLTFLGRVIAHLPVDVLVGKLIVLSFIFGCLEDGIIIGACMTSSKSLFSRPIVDFQPDQAVYSFEEKLIYSKGTCSDSIAMCNAFRQFLQLRNTGGFRSDAELVRWCRIKFIDTRALKEVENLYNDLRRRLERFNIHCTNVAAKPSSQGEAPDQLDAILLPIVLAGAFYPNYFIRDTFAYGETGASKEFSGFDLTNTVMFGGFPINEGDLYRRQISDLVKKYCMHKVLGEPTVYCENSKCFVSFDVEHVMDSLARSNRSSESGLPSLVGRIHPSVLLALKAGRMSNVFRLLHRDPATRDSFVNKLKEFHSRQSAAGLSQGELAAGAIASPLAVLRSQKDFLVQPTHVVNVGHFYGIPKSFIDMEQQLCYQLLNCPKMPLREKPIVGLMALAPFEDGELYRCCILNINKDSSVNVRYIDYGNTGTVPASQLLALPPKLRDYPALAVEIKLAEIKPRGVTHLDGEWTCHETMLFEKILTSRLFSATDKKLDKLFVSCSIFSIVCDIVRVRVNLFEDNMVVTDDDAPTLNQLLVQGTNCRNLARELSATLEELLRRIGAPCSVDGYDLTLAESCTEGYESRQDNLLRKRVFSASGLSTTNTVPDSSTVPINFSASFHGRLNERSELDSLIRDFEAAEIGKGRAFGRGFFTPRGPTHPFEMRFRGLSNSFRRKQIGLDADSVNSVAVDPEPQNPIDRLMIAGSVMLDSKNQNRLVLNHTTLFPQIPGLPTLLCLLFAPQMETRCNEKNATHFTGFLCGMGSVDGKPVDPAHDLLVQPDVMLDNSDLLRINQIRMAANLMTGERDCRSDKLQLVERDLVDLRNRQHRIRQLLRHLFFKTPYPLVPKLPDLLAAGPSVEAWGWPERVGLTSGLTTQQEISHRAIYSLHHSLQDVGLNYKEVLMRDDLQDLIAELNRQLDTTSSASNATQWRTGLHSWLLRWRRFLAEQLQRLRVVVQQRREDGLAYICPVCRDAVGNLGQFLHSLAELEEHLQSAQHCRSANAWGIN